jgi:cell division protein FtsQ
MRRRNKTSSIRNIIKTLPVLFGVMAVFYLAMLIKDIEVPTVLPVNNVQVEGELSFLDKKEIMKTVKNNIVDGYFAVDLKRIREVLLQEPWIKDVSLRRKWPADVTVFIEEQEPIAYWNENGYISEAGDVFKPAAIDKKLNLPRLSGPESQHDNVLKFMNVLYKEMSALNYEVKRLELDDRRAWKLVITSNVIDKGESVENVIDVKLGRFDTEKRLHRFIRMLPALASQIKVTENQIKVIDMRYPNGFAVQMAGTNVTGSVSISTLLRNNLKIQNVTHDFVCARRYATVQMSEA